MKTASSALYKQILARYLPAEAVVPIYDILNRHAVAFHITRERRTKLGDYRWPQPNHPNHEISVNGNLGPYRFLAVLLHEVAHLDTRLFYGSDVSAHGHEWQEAYASRLKEFRHCFPPESRPILDAYISKIPLYRLKGEEFEQLLKRYDPDYNPTSEQCLDDLAVGSLFSLVSRPNMVFLALQRYRTRWLCRLEGNGRTYYVRGATPVHLLKSPQP